MSSQLARNTTYQDVIKLVYKMSHRMARKYFLPFEDVLGQAQILFVYAYDEYEVYKHSNPKRCKFTSWLSNILYWRLTDWCVREYRTRQYVEIKPEICGAYSHKHGWLHDLMRSISDEAKMVVQAIMASPKELMDAIRMHQWDEEADEWVAAEGRRLIHQKIEDYVHGLGWKREEIDRAFKELAYYMTYGEPYPYQPKKKLERAHRKCKLTKGKVWLLTRQYRNQG